LQQDLRIFRINRKLIYNPVNSVGSCKSMAQANQRQFLASKLEALTESEVGEVLDYISVMESSRRPRIASVSEDELLTTLAEAPENRRARQAFEWEAVRRKAEKRAAARVGGYYV
jgi:hypothetical protein